MKWSLLLLLGGCGAVIEPGHRGLLFDPRRGGVQHEVLGPGYYRVGPWAHVEDFDVTFSTKKEDLHTISTEGLAMAVKVSLTYRPVLSELYDLLVEIGPNYYDEVVGPEFRSVAYGVFARHSYLEVQKIKDQLEQEMEAELRRSIHGRHIEVSSVTLEGVDYAPEIAAAVRAKLVAEQEALREKAGLEVEALRRKLELERAEAELRKKDLERQLAAQRAATDKCRMGRNPVERPGDM
jgi:regulator of protease activity HflC (stomatin/prohibitin superfamily)